MALVSPRGLFCYLLSREKAFVVLYNLRLSPLKSGSSNKGTQAAPHAEQGPFLCCPFVFWTLN